LEPLSQTTVAERTWGVMKDLSSCDDSDLLVARERTDEAFAIFYRRHLDDVLRYCARRGLDATTAADVTAETFAAALLWRNRYRPEAGPARAWLLGIASHKIADNGRRWARDRRAIRRLALEPVELTDRDRAEYAELIAEEERASPTTSALADLPADQRTAVYARVVEGESYDEIARHLRISKAVARQRVSRGLRALRLRLGKEQP
jgi:RNA polymerase sigma-70 factor (ECF subfamily)